MNYQWKRRLREIVRNSIGPPRREFNQLEREYVDHLLRKLHPYYLRNGRYGPMPF